MNSLLRIALIFFAVMLAPTAFAAEELQRPDEEKNKKSDVILLDVSKDDIHALPKNSFTPRNDDEVLDNTNVEFSIFDSLIDTNKEEEHPFKIEEESLFGRIYKKKLERTSIPSYLLEDEMTHKFEKGPVDKIRFYGAFQGNFNSFFEGSDYDTEYDLNILEAGVVGDFKDQNTDFKLQFNFKPASDRSFMQNLITDAYIVNSRVPHHKIIVGNSRNQVGVDGGASSYTLPFAFRSQIARNFANTRALGVRVVGNYDLVDYSLALNSSGRFWRQFFPGAEFTGWMNFKPLGKTDGRYGTLILGGGLNAGHNDFTYTTTGFYAAYHYKKFMANFEYSYADGYNGRTLSPNRADGFYSTISYRITQKLHILARYDQFDPNMDTGGDLRREYTAGINYFIKGQALRLILNYVFCQNEREQDSHRIILGTQILL